MVKSTVTKRSAVGKSSKAPSTTKSGRKARTPVRRRPAEPAQPRAARHRGTVTDEDGIRFEGWFNKDGELDGRGTMHFPDGGWQTCTWVDGVPNGEGEYVGDDLSIIRGNWVDGDLVGHVQEYAQGGFLVFDGMYANSRRHGRGVLNFQCGSRIEGDFVDGTLNGLATWWYPDLVSGFKGEWIDGDMHEAKYFGPQPAAPPLPPDKKG